MARSEEAHDLPKANLVSSQLKSTQIEGTMQTLCSTPEFRHQIAQELPLFSLSPQPVIIGSAHVSAQRLVRPM